MITLEFSLFFKKGDWENTLVYALHKLFSHAEPPLILIENIWTRYTKWIIIYNEFSILNNKNSIHFIFHTIFHSYFYYGIPITTESVENVPDICAKVLFFAPLKMQFWKHPYKKRIDHLPKEYSTNFVFNVSHLIGEIFTFLK